MEASHEGCYNSDFQKAGSSLKALPHVTISPTMEFNEIVDDGPATRNDIVNDAGVK